MIGVDWNLHVRRRFSPKPSPPPLKLWRGRTRTKLAAAATRRRRVSLSIVEGVEALAAIADPPVTTASLMVTLLLSLSIPLNFFLH